MKGLSIVLILIFMTGCEMKMIKEVSKGEQVEKPDSTSLLKIKEMAEDLESKGYKTFTYKEGDTAYLMQQYFLVLLKAGPNRTHDSIEAARLQKQHLAHLERMGREGYASLIGPLEGHNEIMGLAVYNTPNKQQADSLANLDPMVKAGRLKVEVYPWWTAKGGKLN